MTASACKPSFTSTTVTDPLPLLLIIVLSTYAHRPASGSFTGNHRRRALPISPEDHPRFKSKHTTSSSVDGNGVLMTFPLAATHDDLVPSIPAKMSRVLSTEKVSDVNPSMRLSIGGITSRKVLAF